MILSSSLLLFGVTIHLPMEAHVGGTEITVGEIAKVEGPSHEVERVEAFTVGYAPAPGFSRLIWGEKLAGLVRKELDVDVVLSGQKACRAWPLVDTIAADEIERAAEARMLEVVGSRDMTFRLREAMVSVDVPAGDRSYVLRTKPMHGKLEAGVVSIPVEVHVEGELYRTIWTSWDVDIWTTVPVVTRRVPAGEKISAGALENRRIQRGRGAGVKPLTPGLLVGSVAARDLAVGEVVSELDIHRPAVITAGTSVFLEVRKGSIVARVPAQARQSGSVGDRIRVVSSDSDREMLAVVVSQGLVAVEL